MTDIKAADLPEGSIVSVDVEVWIRNDKVRGFPWRSTDGGDCSDESVQRELRGGGAVVLRHGYGEGER
jgi:hypothetical protein